MVKGNRFRTSVLKLKCNDKLHVEVMKLLFFLCSVFINTPVAVAKRISNIYYIGLKTTQSQSPSVINIHL